MVDKSISIWGCCIQRDIFGLTADTEYKIDKYISFSSPVSLTQNKIPGLENIDGSELNLPINFAKRCAALDINKNADEYFKESTAKWLLVDIADIRMSLIEATIGGNMKLTISRISKWENIQPQVVSWLKKFSPQVQMTEKKPSSLTDTQLRDSMVKFAAILKKRYREDRIIFNKVQLTPFYLGPNDVLRTFDQSFLVEERNEVINKCTEWFLEELPHCHVIEMPENVLGKYNHKWGCHPLHYVDEYYEYGLKAVNIITSESGDEKSSLRELKAKYDAYFLSLFANAAKNMLNNGEINRMQVDKRKYAGYSTFFKQLLCLPNLEIRLITFFRVNQYNNVAFYGDTEITKVMCQLLNRLGINVAYIVENYDHGTANTVLPRSSKTLPDVDAIFIADILNYEAIEKKLITKLKCPIYRVTDLPNEI